MQTRVLEPFVFEVWAHLKREAPSECSGGSNSLPGLSSQSPNPKHTIISQHRSAPLWNRNICLHGSRTRKTQLKYWIRNDVAEHPGISTLRITGAEHVAHSTVWRFLREKLLFPYHLQRLQGLRSKIILEGRSFVSRSCSNVPVIILYDPHAVHRRNRIYSWWHYESINTRWQMSIHMESFRRDTKNDFQ